MQKAKSSKKNLRLNFVTVVIEACKYFEGSDPVHLTLLEEVEVLEMLAGIIKEEARKC